MLLFLGLLKLVQGVFLPLTAQNVTYLDSDMRGAWLALFTSQSSCQQVAIDFMNASQSNKTEKAQFTIIDCDQLQETCQKYNATSLPQVKLIEQGKAYDSNFELSEAGFLDLGYKNHLRPALSINDMNSLKKFKHSFYSSFILWFIQESIDLRQDQMRQIFEEVARQYRSEQVWFGISVDQRLYEYEGLRISNLPIVLQYGVDEAYNFNITTTDIKQLTKFVEDHKYTMFPKLNQTMFNSIEKYYQENDKIWAIGVLNDSDKIKLRDIRNSMKILAWDLRKEKDTRFQLSWLNITEYPDLAARLQLSDPFWIAVRKGNQTYYTSVDKKDDLREFLDAVYYGNATSEEPPKFIPLAIEISAVADIDPKQQIIIIAGVICAIVLVSFTLACIPNKKTKVD